MRMSSFALAAVLACAALPALAQVQENPAEQAPKQPDQGQTQILPEAAPNAMPNAVPKSQAAPAEANISPKRPSRFTFSRVDNSFLRFDNETGQVAHCSPHASGWACDAVPEERAALEKEIARLQDEVSSLKTQVALLTAPPPHPVPPQPVPPPGMDKDGGVQIKLPSAEDIAQARAFLQSAWRRLVDMIGNIQKDMMQKG
jgi:hypothetical protein